MSNRLLFATFDPLAENATQCTACKENLPIFRYEFHNEDQAGQPYDLTGFCCETCAAHLLKALECTESVEWAEEEATLAAGKRNTKALRNRIEQLRDVLIS